MLRRWLAVRRLLVASVILGLALGGVALASTQTTARPNESKSTGRLACGVERWAVKTLQDPAGKALDLSTIKKTTVGTLRSLPVQRGPAGSRGQGAESTVYEVRARLVSAKLEEDDDIHLVIKGATTSGTMIVEFPTVGCSNSATAGAKTRVRNARNAFVVACGMPGGSSFTMLKGRATIRGVGFFDFLHGQTGVAPNGVELHPVLRFTEATCERVTTGSKPPPPPPPSPGKCDPNYAGACVPPYPPDLDCADLRALGLKLPVKVVGSDPHRLDGDGDGYGCE